MIKKTVLVTGASGDIGKEIARTFADNNYTVIGVYYQNETSIKSLAQELGSCFHYFQCDLSHFSASKDLIENIRKAGFSIDVLVNNAGISYIGLLQTMTESNWNTLWNTNVTSAVALSGQVIPLFLQQGYGKIINISSVWGNSGASCETGYSATKGAINTFTKALALELAPSNIQVNAVSCGIIDTKMNSHLSSDELSEIIQEIPSGRLGTPKDIADTVYAVACAGSYMTGQIITIDGGWQI